MSYVHDREHQVATFERLADLDHHLPAEGTIGLVYARSIDENNLRAVAPFALAYMHDALNAVARGLRLRRNDRQLFADQRVEQRRTCPHWGVRECKRNRSEMAFLNRTSGVVAPGLDISFTTTRKRQ